MSKASRRIRLEQQQQQQQQKQHDRLPPRPSALAALPHQTPNESAAGTANNDSESVVVAMAARNASAKQQQKKTSLVLLSAVWLTLCSVLVFKDRNLLQVFYAFSASFALAALLRPVLDTATPSPADRNGIACRNSRLLKHGVGWVDCCLAMGMLLFLGAGRQPPGSSEYATLSIAAGYLAFDHWFSALYQCQEKSLWWGGVAEDATTLILVLVVLATARDLERYRMGTLAWLLYKIILLSWKLISNIVASSTSPGPRRSDSAAPVPLSEAVMKKTLEKNSEIRTRKEKEGAVTAPSYWTIHGVDYDLAHYVKNHPGGVEAILLGQGRDCTALFQSYHPFTSRHVSVLGKYRVQDKNGGQRAEDGRDLVSSFRSHDPFYQVLCNRVEDALRQKGFDPVKNRTASWGRAVYYLGVAVAVICSGLAHCRGSIAGSFLFAVFGWLFGALGHDAGHFSASRVPFINDVGVWGMSLLCNPVIWQHQHTYAHHSHTNDFERDPDLHHFNTFIRVHRNFQRQDIYKNQSSWLYVVFAYAFVVFGTCIWIPWGVVKEGSMYGVVEWSDRKRPLRATGMWAHLLAYVAIIAILPFRVHASWLAGLVAVVAHVATSGLMFALFSQINHLNEASLEARESNDRDPMLKNSWAACQIETSNNFAADSVFWHFLSNGLNLQIEHHLFPGLNHCHLHHIAPVVKATCEEYGVCYKSYESWNDVFQATLSWLDMLANELDDDDAKKTS